jgi:hypothetical protein
MVLLLLNCMRMYADEYFFWAMPVVEKRIAQGGVRLAAILNRIFSRNNDSRLQSL